MCPNLLGEVVLLRFARSNLVAMPGRRDTGDHELAHEFAEQLGDGVRNSIEHQVSKLNDFNFKYCFYSTHMFTDFGTGPPFRGPSHFPVISREDRKG